ncbi:insulin-like growth factor-binding protein 3 receptor [Mantella aurantiaca]
MSWQPCQSLRPCLLRHPPMVAFFLCVVTLGFTYLALGAYVRTQPMRDIDFSQDWGGILQALGAGKICPQGNSSRGMTTGEGASTENPKDNANVSVLITFTVSPWQLVTNHSNLQIKATGAQLGMKGPGADNPLTITLTSYWSSDYCNASEAECSVKYCLILTGPRDLLPQYTGSLQCPVNGSGVPAVPVMSVLEAEPNASTECYSLAYNGYLAQNVIPGEDTVLCAQRLRNAAFVILFLGLLWIVLFIFCIPPFKEKKTGGPL